MQKLNRFSVLIALILTASSAYTQPESFQLLDGIMGVVGDEIILHSEMQERIVQEQMQIQIHRQILHQQDLDLSIQNVYHPIIKWLDQGKVQNY